MEFRKQQVLEEALMLQSTRTDAAGHPHLEDFYGRIGIGAVAAAARYGRKDKRAAPRDAEPAGAEPRPANG